jgi:hypothetical protein
MSHAAPFDTPGSGSVQLKYAKSISVWTSVHCLQSRKSTTAVKLITYTSNDYQKISKTKR